MDHLLRRIDVFVTVALADVNNARYDLLQSVGRPQPPSVSRLPTQEQMRAQLGLPMRRREFIAIIV